MINWDYFNLIEKKHGRPASSWDVKWLNSLRTTAWYSYLELSGFDFKNIDLSFQSSAEYNGNKFTQDYAAIDRQWRYWRDGVGTVKREVLDEVEKFIPGSLETYAIGPDGSRLWLSYQSSTNFRTELLSLECPIPVDSNFNQVDLLNNPKFFNPDIIEPEMELDENRMSLTGLGSSYKENSLWFEITYVILAYLFRQEMPAYPWFETDAEGLIDAIIESRTNAKIHMLNILKENNDEIRKYGLYPEDLIYPFMKELLFNDPRKIDHQKYKFGDRTENPVWNEISAYFHMSV